jgi:hypothetical protein
MQSSVVCGWRRRHAVCIDGGRLRILGWRLAVERAAARVQDSGGDGERRKKRERDGQRWSLTLYS